MAELLARATLRDTGRDTVRAIGLANACFLLLTVSDIAAVVALPVVDVVGAMLGRGAIGGVVVAAFAFLNRGGTGRRGWQRLMPVRWRMVLLRSVIHAGSSLTWYVAWQYGMPLAESYAVAYAAPLLMTVIAVPMLGERLGARRMVATAIGFLGMLIMLQPGGALWTPLTLLLLVGVAGMALSRALTRLLAVTETAECLTFWLLLLHLPVGGMMLFAGFAMPGLNWNVATSLLVLGAGTGLGHWFLSRAAALAPIGALAPYEYTVMLWGVGLGYWMFGQVPSWATLAGSAVVAAAGIDNFYREHQRSRAERLLTAGGGLSSAPMAVAQRNDV